MRLLGDRVRRGVSLPALPLTPEAVDALLDVDPVRPVLAGIGEPTHEVILRGPAGLPLRVPVEATLAELVNVLTDRWDPDVAEQGYNLYYESHLRDRDLSGPTYHLGVLCVMLGLGRLAAAIADDLSRCRPRVPGSACLLAACATGPDLAITRLRNAGIRHHALRIDSRRGDLAPPSPVPTTDAATAAFLDRMRDLRPRIMGGARLIVTTSRPARFVEEEVERG